MSEPPTPTDTTPGPTDPPTRWQRARGRARPSTWSRRAAVLVTGVVGLVVGVLLAGLLFATTPAGRLVADGDRAAGAQGPGREGRDGPGGPGGRGGEQGGPGDRGSREPGAGRGWDGTGGVIQLGPGSVVQIAPGATVQMAPAPGTVTPPAQPAPAQPAPAQPLPG